MLETKEKVYTVSQLTYEIKNLIEGNPNFQNITLKGEISNFTHHRTGHLYFSLKDEKTQIRAIMFAGNARYLKFKPKEGDKVTVKGTIDLYAPSGSYSIQVRSMSPDGEGELYLRYLELKKSLEELGWFDKKPKPLLKYPKAIGVVTSATGAVIEDITNTINRRYRLTKIILYPALVQGVGASKSIAEQIKKANKDKLVDVLIVGRGGGSIEDLWGFNEIETIEAIYTSNIPVITAIGHETDTTISDFVSDYRASTPTAAAEIATPDTKDLIENIIKQANSIKYMYKEKLRFDQRSLMHLIERLELNGPKNKIKDAKIKIDNEVRLLNNNIISIRNQIITKYNNLNVRLKNASPENKLKQNQEKLSILNNNLNINYNNVLYNKKIKYKNLNEKVKPPTDLINRKKETLKLLTKNTENEIVNVLTNKFQIFKLSKSKLESINPLKIMDRGFALVKTDEKIITSIKDINIDDNININLKDGNINAKVIEKKER